MLAAFCPLTAPCAPRLSCPQVVRCASVVGASPLAQAQRVPSVQPFFSIRFFPATKRNRHEKPHATACQLHQSNRLSPAHPTKVICHFFRKGQVRTEDRDQAPVLRCGWGYFRDGLEPRALTVVAAQFARPISRLQHHGSLRPLQVLARPSDTRISPRLRLSLTSTRSLRP